MLLPVLLMLLRAIGELTLDEGNRVCARSSTSPARRSIALLAGVILAMFTLGVAVGYGRGRISGDRWAARCPAIAGILLIVAAGGGFKQVLVDAGVGKMIGDAAEDSEHI